MLKWIFGILLVTNVVFFALLQWGSALTVDASISPAQAPLNADKIKIIIASAPVSAVAVSSSVIAPASAPTVAAPASVVANVPVTTVPTPPVIPKITPPPRVVEPSALPLPVAPIPAPPMITPPAPAKLSCFEWGEFSGVALQQANKALAELKFSEKPTQHIVEYNVGSWVYIPPLKSATEIKKKIEQLKKLGVEDYFVMQEAGPWKNAISLGMFKTEDAAKKYLSKLKIKGVKSAQFNARASKLKYTVFSLRHLDSTLASQVKAIHANFPESEIKEIPCH